MQLLFKFQQFCHYITSLKTNINKTNFLLPETSITIHDACGRRKQESFGCICLEPTMQNLEYQVNQDHSEIFSKEIGLTSPNITN